MAKQVQVGYKLSSEEFSGPKLVELARAAEDRGFAFALISDHYHPWIDRQGQSPFVWSVLGGIAQRTKKLVVGTGVTCPTTRLHPAIIAQAAATVATMLPERFFLGVGSGENLNEHIVANGWPEVDIRQERLAEAIEVIRLLWKGGMQSFHGRHFVVENARVYSLPAQAPALLIAAAGPKAAKLAAKLGEGLIATQPDGELVKEFRAAGGKANSHYGELTVCFDRDKEAARQMATEAWPTAAMPGVLQQELPLPSHFEKAAQLVSKEKVTEHMPCGPDVEEHLKAIREFADAGYDHVCVHQVGTNQQQFLDFYAKEILPKFR